MKKSLFALLLAGAVLTAGMAISGNTEQVTDTEYYCYFLGNMIEGT